MKYSHVLCISHVISCLFLIKLRYEMVMSCVFLIKLRYEMVMSCAFLLKPYFSAPRCPQEWGGPLCRESIPEECQLHCLNDGHCSHCNKDGTTAMCVECACSADYGGPRCDKAMGVYGERSDGSTVIAVVVPALLCVLIVLVILGICIYRRRAK